MRLDVFRRNAAVFLEDSPGIWSQLGGEQVMIPRPRDTASTVGRRSIEHLRHLQTSARTGPAGHRLSGGGGGIIVGETWDGVVQYHLMLDHPGIRCGPARIVQTKGVRLDPWSPGWTIDFGNGSGLVRVPPHVLWSKILIWCMIPPGGINTPDKSDRTGDIRVQ